MKLNQNSISAKIYRWFYLKTEMPSNLCPYFWKLVIAYALLIPVLVVTLVYETIYINASRADKPADSPGERFVLGILAWVLLYLAVAALSPIILLWEIPTKDSWMWNTVSAGFVVWACIIIIGISLLYKHLKEKRDDAKWKKRNEGRQSIYDENGHWVGYRYEEPKPNILIEFIKAKYNKYCPKIDWN